MRYLLGDRVRVVGSREGRIVWMPPNEECLNGYAVCTVRVAKGHYPARVLPGWVIPDIVGLAVDLKSGQTNRRAE